MDEIYERIVRLEGDCFNDKYSTPNCSKCAFLNKCLSLTISVGKHIPSDIRLRWALDKLAEEILLDVKI